MPQHPSLTPVRSPSQVREARQLLNTCGNVSAQLLGPVLARSWERSAAAGLPPCGRAPGAPHASALQLRQAQEHHRELLSHARPVMEFLHEQTRDTDSMVILADAEGMLLHALGDAQFIQRAERVALRPGATWHERWRGTNAIGTALIENEALVVHGGEHYLERNGFLTCAAAPIHDPSGRLLGALDLSGDHRGFHRHTLGLVRSAVRMIEHRLFETRHGAGLRLRLHTLAEGIATLTESLLAISEDGWVIGANEAALNLFQLSWTDVGALQVSQLIDPPMKQWLDKAARGGRAPQPVQTRDGRTLWMQVDSGRTSITMAMPASAISSPTQSYGGGAGPAHNSAGRMYSFGAPPPAPSATVPASAELQFGMAPLGASSQLGADALAQLDTGDAALRTALERARRVLDKPIALLLQGESGVGKEVFARAVHASGPRRHKAFVAVNCAALPDTLIEAELFGYRPGAFTGASREGAPGRIREADGGVLFLDEIGDMPIAMQGRLLRVLQERQVVPLGGGKPVPVDIQLVCATHRQLRDEMRTGRFREDLYYRLNGLTLQLPALRDRQDLPSLISRLLQEISPLHPVALTPELERRLAVYRWPGNLRQLANALRTACALMDSHEGLIDWPHLPDDLAEDLRACELPQDPPPGDGETDLRQVSARTTLRAVQDAQGNLSEAARRLGISRNTLYRKLRELGGKPE